MPRGSSPKKVRQTVLAGRLEEDPFLTDEELAEIFSVSVPTIRLDRLELGIPELRERVRNVASRNYSKVRALGSGEIVGEIIELNLNESAISIFETTQEMAFEKNRIVRGQYIYSLAESIAIAVIDADVALVGVANIKYKVPVTAGSRLISRAEVKQQRKDSYIVWVRISEKQTDVFRGKFILKKVM